ncbi:MAG: hypothetical protein B6229_08390 [Spirochaetaceae bacterium 4572_7]|nr:MAG: hypothetical protein B6229_08390 [Spirochaetaceae bacterium 4572_7]
MNVNMDQIEIPEDEMQPENILDETLLGEQSLFLDEDPAFESLSSTDDLEFNEDIPGIDTEKITELSETEISKLREEKLNTKDEFKDTPPEEDIIISKKDFPGNDPFSDENSVNFDIDEADIHVPESHNDFEINNAAKNLNPN